MIDLDEFKKINDKYGHITGDIALRNIAAIMTRSFPKDAFIARYGGDEFTVLLNIKDEKSLCDQIEIFKKQVELFNQKGKEVFNLKISLGYSVYTIKYNEGLIF